MTSVQSKNVEVPASELSTAQREVLAKKLQVRAALLGIPGVVLLFWALWMLFRPIESSWIKLLCFPAAYVLSSTGWSFYRRSKQYLALDGNELLKQDPRSPVVYLRPFNADAIAGNSEADYYAGEYLISISEEEQIAASMNEIGPFVAIGRPGESLPQLGAARVYVDDEHWRETVSGWVNRAQMVVLRPGFTKGFEWEIIHIIQTVRPEKIVFLLPWGPNNGYDSFRRDMAQHFPKGLPEWKGKWEPARSLYGVLSFAPDWTPRIEKLKKPFYLRRGGIGYFGISTAYALTGTRYWLTAFLKRALDPVVHQLGLVWRTKPSRPGLRPLTIWALIFGMWASTQVYSGLQLNSLEEERESLSSEELHLLDHDFAETSATKVVLEGRRAELQERKQRLETLGGTRGEIAQFKKDVAVFDSDVDAYTAKIEQHAAAAKDLQRREEEFNRKVQRLKVNVKLFDTESNR